MNSPEYRKTNVKTRNTSQSVVVYHFYNYYKDVICLFIEFHMDFCPHLTFLKQDTAIH